MNRKKIDVVDEDENIHFSSISKLIELGQQKAYVTIDDICSAIPFENNLISFSFTGQQLLDWVKINSGTVYGGLRYELGGDFMDEFSYLSFPGIGIDLNKCEIKNQDGWIEHNYTNKNGTKFLGKLMREMFV